jgi:excisionase family DNA binding protein
MTELHDTNLLTAAELADRLKVKADTVRAWARQGRIPARRLSHKVVRFNLADVVAALESARSRGVAR